MTPESGGSIPRRVHASAFLRSFAIQGSWNYRTMLGQGFAFALLPVLRHVHAGDEAGLDRALRRHAGHFNAHPYLAGVALGAVARMEVDGEDPEKIGRFKTAVRGPLGGLGDRLIWVAALPAAALAALVAAGAGAPPWVPPLLFLVSYNAGHLVLRFWAYRTGVREGAGVAQHLRAIPFARIADRLASAAALLLGVLVGLIAVRAAKGGSVGTTTLLLVPAFAALVLGARWGPSAWRHAAVLTVLVVAAGAALGGLL